MEKRFSLLILGLFFISLSLGGLFQPLNLDRSIESLDLDEVVLQGHPVLSCVDSEYTCGTEGIDFVRESCESWHAYDNKSSLDCEKSREGVQEVNFMTDPANYVDIPIAEQEYTVESANTSSYPWDLEFLPNGDKIMTRIGGEIIHVTPNNTRKYQIDATTYFEAGLLGLAVDPNFQENQFIYVYYTNSKTERKSLGGDVVLENRVSRFRLTETGLEDEKILVTVPGNKYHSGGRLEFGPDEKLYVTTGDSGFPRKARETSFLGGKVLRLNRDGSVPADNPFEDSLVYSMGHRNPQGLAWNPETGSLYTSEHGPFRHDELNRVVRGEDSGWGDYRCNDRSQFYGGTSNSEYSPPVKCFDEWTIAPSGMTFVDDPGHPWHGDLFLAGLRGKQIYRADIEKGVIIDEEVFYVSDDEESISLRLRDVEYSEGSIYIIGDKSGIAKLTPK